MTHIVLHHEIVNLLHVRALMQSKNNATAFKRTRLVVGVATCTHVYSIYKSK